MELLADRYDVGPPIGYGRSTVYRGLDTVLQRAVALKEVKLSEGHEAHDRVRARARREAHAAARLHNPSVVDIFDIIEDDGSLWLVMELVDAPNLAQVVRDEGPLSHQRAAQIGLDVLGALAAAHAAGVVHRDVKPANVLVRPDAPAKLADFGVATIRGETRVTSTGMVIGSPAYMAPEQARGESAGSAADLWALGATLYFAVEGTAPFEGSSAIATASAVVHSEPRAQRNPGPLSRIVGQLLAKNPQDRPTVGEVHTALLAATRQRAAAAAPAPAPTKEIAPSDAAPSTETLPAHAPAPVPSAGYQAGDTAPPPERSVGRMALGLGFLVVLGLIVWAAWGRAGGSDDDDTAAGDQDSTATTADEPEATTTSEATTSAPATSTTIPATTAPASSAPVVPAGWVVYTSPSGAYSIAHPPGWEVVPAGGPRVDFRDPATGTYLRVDWTDEPRSDPVADWQQQASRFGSTHDGYREHSIAAYDYRGYNAALWEFSYRSGGADLHAGNLGFVTGNRGYALLFQTDEASWAASHSLFAGFRDAFQPVSR